MTEAEAIRLFKCLSDKSRLQILKSLAIEDMDVERLAERLGLTAATISFHLKKLADAGAVTSYKNQYYTMYSLCKECFMTSLLDIIQEESGEAQLQTRRDEEYRQKVLDAFFEYGKLKTIPAQRKKKRIVLEEIAKAFEHDRIYTEREVNILIADYHDDFCTIRRDMIGEQLLDRNKDGYWLMSSQGK
ncbi:MAG: metalloregulator ArsR/SmtB family transcription factor [Clostridiales bacterium]|nr:metalloregulator ArsR/SmtB family transcription factor [Clostridiales bacterium]